MFTSCDWLDWLLFQIDIHTFMYTSISFLHGESYHVKDSLPQHSPTMPMLSKGCRTRSGLPPSGRALSLGSLIISLFPYFFGCQPEKPGFPSMILWGNPAPGICVPANIWYVIVKVRISFFLLFPAGYYPWAFIIAILLITSDAVIYRFCWRRLYDELTVRLLSSSIECTNRAISSTWSLERWSIWISFPLVFPRM